MAPVGSNTAMAPATSARLDFAANKTGETRARANINSQNPTFSLNTFSRLGRRLVSVTYWLECGLEHSVWTTFCLCQVRETGSVIWRGAREGLVRRLGFSMDIRLQPLRIPTGWHVEYNNGLWEIDPVAELIPHQPSAPGPPRSDVR